MSDALNAFYKRKLHIPEKAYKPETIAKVWGGLLSKQDNESDLVREKTGKVIAGRGLTGIENAYFGFVPKKILNPNNDKKLEQKLDMANSAFWGIAGSAGGAGKNWIKGGLKASGKVLKTYNKGVAQVGKTAGRIDWHLLKNRYKLKTLPKNKQTALKKHYQNSGIKKYKDKYGTTKDVELKEIRKRIDSNVKISQTNPYEPLGKNRQPTFSELFNTGFATSGKRLRGKLKKNLLNSGKKTKGTVQAGADKWFEDYKREIKKGITKFAEDAKAKIDFESILYPSKTKKPMEGSETGDVDNDIDATTIGPSTPTSEGDRTNSNTRNAAAAAASFYTGGITDDGYDSDDERKRRK